MFSDECKKLGSSKIGIAGYLKNWRALRFWIKAGFNNVISIKYFSIKFTQYTFVITN